MAKIGEITVRIIRKTESIFIGYDSYSTNMAPPFEVHAKALKGNAKSHGVI